MLNNMFDKTTDLKAMYLLKLTSLRHLIANTNMGVLECNIRKDENTYFFTLDSVPLPRDLDNDLLKLYGI
jgi:hypothetical protein